MGDAALSWLHQTSASELSINLAGRQRMLSQRITLLTINSDDTSQVDYQQNLEAHLQEWQAAHLLLLEGDESLGIGSINDEAIRQDLLALSPIMDDMVLASRCISQLEDASECTETSETLEAQLLNQQNEFLMLMDDIVADMEGLLANQRKDHQRNFWILILFEVVGFIGIGLLLLRPSLRHTAQLVDGLSQSQEMLEEQQVELKKQASMLEDAAKLASIGVWEVPMDTMNPIR